MEKDQWISATAELKTAVGKEPEPEPQPAGASSDYNIIAPFLPTAATLDSSVASFEPRRDYTITSTTGSVNSCLVK